LPLSTFLIFDFGNVLTVWYFRNVPTVWYFGTVLTVWYFGTVLTVWYFYFLFFIGKAITYVEGTGFDPCSRPCNGG
jgi:hypothetical protein